MKLACIESNGTAQCLVCSWKWKVPAHRRNSGRGFKPTTLVLLTKEQRVKLLEEQILLHLKESHDRILVTREEVPLKDAALMEGLFQKTYYHGRSPFRG